MSKVKGFNKVSVSEFMDFYTLVPTSTVGKYLYWVCKLLSPSLSVRAWGDVWPWVPSRPPHYAGDTHLYLSRLVLNIQDSVLILYSY